MSSQAASLTYFRWPKSVVGRFVTRRTLRSAAVWALVFGLYAASKAIGYAQAYPTYAERVKLAVTYGHNIGMEALLGTPRHLENIAASTAWNTGSVMVMVGSIWALLLATKVFRGEEEAGRWELLLSGQTTARRATINAIAGLGATLSVFYVIIAILFTALGHDQKVNFSGQAALYFALTIMTTTAVFMLVGALTSQLMPTRSRAAGLAVIVFGVSFLLRAMADTTSAHWILNITPLGWAEKTHPLYGSQPQWLLPSLGLIVVLTLATVYLASKRDLSGSTFADKDTARPHLALLGGPLGAAVRLTRGSLYGWWLAVAFVLLFMSLLTKSASHAFSESANAEHVISRLAHQSQVVGAETFLGIVFLIAMTLIMTQVASGLGALREEEASGHLDNLLVRSTSRLSWLFGRSLLVAAGAVLAGVLAAAAAMLGTAGQQLGVSFHTLLMAGLNAAVPAQLILGIGLLTYGFVPRLTSAVAYGVIAWSFLLEMVSSGININHWVMDSCVFQHMILSPVADPNWGRNGVLLAIGLAGALIGALKFNRRDLQAE